MVHDAMEDFEGKFETYPARSMPTFPARVRFRFRNTYWRWGAAIQGVSIRTGLDKYGKPFVSKLPFDVSNKTYLIRSIYIH